MLEKTKDKKSDKQVIKKELVSLLEKSKSALVVCDDYEDVSFYNAVDFSVFEIYLGKIYKYKNLKEFHQKMHHVSGVNLFENMQKSMVQAVEENGEFKLIECNAGTVFELNNKIAEINKKRKKQEKKHKKHIKNGKNEENNAESDKLVIGEISVKFSSPLYKAIIKNDLMCEDFFYIAFDKNKTMSEAIGENNFLFFVESTGERVLI